MTKTENYQLPQWEAADPVRREDFNRMCAKIETGLTDLRDDQSTLARLRRVGYDLYQTAARSICAGVPGGTMKGGVFNSLTSKDELGRMSGLAPLSDGGCFIGASTAMTLAKLNAAIYSWEDGEAASITSPATARVRFRSNFRGTITKLDVWYQRTTTINTGNLVLYIRLYDLDSGRYVYQSGSLTGSVLAYTTTTDSFSVSVPVEPNHDYQLELYTGGGVFSGTIGFGTYGTQALTGTVTGSAMTSGTVTESVTLDTPALCAVALVHYTGGTAPTAEVDNTPMAAAASRPGVSLRGASCTEAEFSLSGEWSGTVSLTAHFQSTADQTIHDVLFYLI